MKFKFFILIPVLSFLFAGVYYLYCLQPVSSSKRLQLFIINQGDSLSSIASRLQKSELVRNRLAFIISAYQLGFNNKLRAGTFELSPHLSTTELIQKLTTAGSHDIWITILPGTRLEEIASVFEPFGVSPSDFLRHPQVKEGYLNPDSYKIPDYYTLDQILKVINRDSATIDLSILTLASLLEREGRSLTVKQQIAGILLNRLKINMPLQVDATAQYARDSRNPPPKKYWLPISKADLKIKSEYNTYLNSGLPPTPICNPGPDSIKAAQNPIPSEYLFYITGNDGLLHPAKTLDEHNANIAKYLN